METFLIDLEPIFSVLIGILATILSVVGGFLIAWLQKRIGVENQQIDQFVREYLNTALERAVDYASVQLRESGTVSIETNSAFVKMAADYVLQHVPDAVAYFGISEVQLKELVIARLRELFPETVSVVPVSEGTVIPGGG